MKQYIIGIDIGGTFSDVVIMDEEGNVTSDKALTTPKDPSQGTISALENCVQRMGVKPREVLRKTEVFSHGTTIGTNSLIQRKGAKVGLIMTKGFGDTTIIARGPMGRICGIDLSQALDFIHTERAEPIVPKQLIREVSERVAADGKVIIPLHDEDVKSAMELFLREKVEAIAVCLLWSYLEPSHEKKVREIIQTLDKKSLVSLSSEVSPVMGEYERAVTTAVNAYLAPVVLRYITNLQSELEQQGFRRTIQIMKCSGGLTLPQNITREAAFTVNSGPVGGLVAAKYMGAILGYENIVTSDVGGTSFDVGVIHRGEYEREKEPFVSHGIPLQVSAIKVACIGAGGGSIARSDGIRLTVGPESAGAEPGPVCYDRGGTEPTVTDALVVLGYVDPDYFFGGRLRLNKAKAEQAISERIARPLNLGVMQAAAGIYEIATLKMSDLIRKVTVESGYDPRDFVLFAYGGGGPAHCAIYAGALGVREAIIPNTAAVFSALGIALSDIERNYPRSEPMTLARDPEVIRRFNEVFQELEQTAIQDAISTGILIEDLILTRKLDMRYGGQLKEITIPWQRKELTLANIAEVRDAFENAYETKFGMGLARAESPLEVVTFRVDATRLSSKPQLYQEESRGEDSRPALKGVRQAYFDTAGLLDTAIYERHRLASGNIIAGPAVIEDRDMSAVIPPEYQARVDSYRNIRISKT